MTTIDGTTVAIAYLDAALEELRALGMGGETERCAALIEAVRIANDVAKERTTT